MLRFKCIFQNIVDADWGQQIIIAWVVDTCYQTVGTISKSPLASFCFHLMNTEVDQVRHLHKEEKIYASDIYVEIEL